MEDFVANIFWYVFTTADIGMEIIKSSEVYIRVSSCNIFNIFYKGMSYSRNIEVKWHVVTITEYYAAGRLPPRLEKWHDLDKWHLETCFRTAGL